MSDRTPEPGIELLSIRWERVQVIVDARATTDAATDPRSFDLRHAASDTRFPPTHATIEDGRITLRYNVMTGPGLDPLQTGRWTLGARVTNAAVATDAVDSQSATEAFHLADRVYTVAPVLDAAAGTLSFEVSIDLDTRPAAVDDPSPATGGVRRAGRRVAVRSRQVAFQLLVWAAGLLDRRSKPEVLFASALISEMSGNLKAVRDRMIERGLDRDHDLVTILRPRAGEPRGLSRRLRLARALARAEVIMLDDSYPPLHWIRLRPGVRIIQLWHAAGAFKTVGYSRVGTPADADRFARVHRDYTAAIVSSPHDIPFYAEAFGIPEERVIPTGIPRMDRFFDARAQAAGLAAARRAYPQCEGRFTILYAPTFRGHGPTTATFDIDRLDYAALHAVAADKDAMVIIRMHPAIREPLAIPEPLRDRLIDGSRAGIDVNDLLFAIDLLITDYSSIVFEFSALGRPMLFYAYDLDDYIGDRDFYVPFETFVPGRIVRTFRELVDAIRRDDYQVEKVADFSARHFAHHDAHSSDRVIDQLVLAR